jgi:hypothetical protein
MYKSKIFVLFIVVAFILFGVSQFLGNEMVCRVSRALILPLFTIMYFATVQRKTLFFSLFLLSYAISDLMELSENQVPYFLYYFIGNILYVMAYGFLFLEICKSVNLFHMLKNYKIHVMVLTLLNVYIVYVLQVIIDPYTQLDAKYFLELSYNIMMLLLLSASLLNYFYRDNKKALFLFIGSLCIVFSEVINVAYLYITETSTLNFISSTLAVLAFYFYFQQSKLENEVASRIVTQ